MQLGEGEVAVGDLGEEGPCEAPEEVQEAAGSPGLRAKLHYVVLAAMHPEENQRLSGLMGWADQGYGAGVQSWLKERGLCFC